jgi:hypothetical protein
MPKTQKSRRNRTVSHARAKALVVLSGDERALYKKSLAKWDRKLKPLTDSIRAAQTLSKEDLDIRINTRD